MASSGHPTPRCRSEPAAPPCRPRARPRPRRQDDRWLSVPDRASRSGSRWARRLRSRCSTPWSTCLRRPSAEPRVRDAAGRRVRDLLSGYARRGRREPGVSCARSPRAAGLANAVLRRLARGAPGRGRPDRCAAAPRCGGPLPPSGFPRGSPPVCCATAARARPRPCAWPSWTLRPSTWRPTRCAKPRRSLCTNSPAPACGRLPCPAWSGPSSWATSPRSPPLGLSPAALPSWRTLPPSWCAASRRRMREARRSSRLGRGGPPSRSCCARLPACATRRRSSVWTAWRTRFAWQAVA